MARFVVVAVMLLQSLSLSESCTGGCVSSGQQAYVPNGWQKFTVLIGGVYTNVPPPTNVFNVGDFLVGDNVIINQKRNTQIGQAFQTCKFPPPLNNVQSFNFDCLFVFSLTFSNGKPGQIMAQGPFYRKEINPASDPNTPNTQFITITGGTGCFVGVFGIIRIEPTDLAATPPLYGYTFYFKFG